MEHLKTRLEVLLQHASKDRFYIVNTTIRTFDLSSIHQACSHRPGKAEQVEAIHAKLKVLITQLEDTLYGTVIFGGIAQAAVMRSANLDYASTACG
jgi:hypothetical protein